MSSQTQRKIKAIEKELKTLPPGNLVMKRTFYYHSVNRKEAGITKNEILIRKLARKAFLKASLKILKQNEKYEAKCIHASPREIIDGLSKTYQSLPYNYFFILTDNSWASAAYKKNPAHPEDLIYRTNSGLMVRSKSEREIANALDEHGIPYRYEMLLYIDGKATYPDFTIMINGRIFLWEHLGRMDKPDYRQRTAEKLKLYGTIGYFPFDNLICTYEHDMQDPEQINGLIHRFLLKL